MFRRRFSIYKCHKL